MAHSVSCSCMPNKTLNPFDPNIKNLNSHMLSLHVLNRCIGENLLKYQLDSSSVIMTSILMTTLFYKVLILQGEISCR